MSERILHLESEIRRFDAMCAEYRKSLDTLRGELQVERLVRRDSQRKSSQLESQLAAKDREIERLTDDVRTAEEASRTVINTYRFALKERESELEKLREGLHLALTMRDKYFIQLGEAQRALKDIHEKAEASRAANGNALAFAVLKLTREVLKTGREG